MEPPHARPMDILARMASNREPVIPSQLRDSLDPLSSSSFSPPLPDLKSDSMSRDRVGSAAGGTAADAGPFVLSGSSAAGGAGAVSEGGGEVFEQGGVAEGAVVGGGDSAADAGGSGGGRDGVFGEVRDVFLCMTAPVCDCPCVRCC